MDTKSTRFKYTNLAKAICLLLATLLFSLGTWCAVEFGTGIMVFGGDAYLRGSARAGEQPYTATPTFRDVLQFDIGNLGTLALTDETGFGKALGAAQEETVDEIVDQYIARQKYLKQQKLDPEEEPFGRSPNVHLDFGNGSFDTEIDFDYENMALSEKEIRKELDRQYDSWEQEQLRQYRFDRQETLRELNDNECLKYYVRSIDGNVYTNLREKPSLKALQSHKVAIAKDSKNSFVQGIDFLESDNVEDLVGMGDITEGAAVRIYLKDSLFQELGQYEDTRAQGLRSIIDADDDYIATKQLYDAMKDRPAGWVLAIMIFSYLFGLALLLWFLHLVGHVNADPQVYATDGTPEPVRYAKDGSRLTYAAIDKLPGDIHFLLSGAFFGVCLGLPLAFMADNADDYSLWRWFPLLGALTTFVCLLILGEWLASVCRTVKSGRGFWKNTIVIRLLRWCWGVLKKFGEYCKTTWHLTEYTPKHLHKHTIWMAVGYVAVNFFLAMLLSSTVHNGTLGVFFLLALIAFNVWVIAKLVTYLKELDLIIEGSEAGSDVELDTTDLPVSLKTLAGNMAVSRERIDAAVSKAVKEEQTRTELITNVTHDLKTPLTSLINYSDLLDRKAETQELGDEESTRYVGVIHDQSEKLKRLIDDLLEASKVSTGNVQLNLSPLNLTELAAQAIAEFAPEMEKNGNEVVFVDGSGQPAAVEHRVYADGSKTYRILSNLLSNAQKYSAPGTRIYATVSDGPAGAEGVSLSTVFELKNISAAPLNISAEELMARFVRGDRSRGETEGNGLGLSIARDLAVLMGGRLDLTIDGDLFKATVTLPKE